MNRLLSLLLVMVIGFTTVTMTTGAQQSATPASDSTNQVECEPLGPNEEFTILVIPNGETREAGTIVILREKRGDTIDVRVECLQEDTVITVDAWEGYPSVAYAQVDACIEAQRVEATAEVEGSWAEGSEVTLDGQPVPETCIPDLGVIEGDTTLQAEQGEVVPAGTIAVVREVDFVSGTVRIDALELTEDTTAMWNQSFHRHIWYGYTDLDEATDGACTNGRDLFEETLVPRSWNEDFTVFVNGTQVNSADEVCA